MAEIFVRNISHCGQFSSWCFWDYPDFRFPVRMKKIPGEQNALNGIVPFLTYIPLLGMLV
jgi:hypothetical protein